MRIICDTREKNPLLFQHEYITEVKKEKLIIGDYQAIFKDDYRPPFAFERKSLQDIFQTLSRNYKRFKKEILRAQKNKIFLIIIIEASLSKIIAGYERSYRSGDEVVQQLFSIMVRHFVPFVCVQNREEASRFITEFYLALGRKHILDKKEKK